MMQLDEQRIDLGVLVSDFLRQDEDAARPHAGRDTPDKRRAIARVDELQRVVHHDHGGILDRHLAEVALDDLHRRRAVIGSHDFAASLDHGRREIHGDDVTVFGDDTATHGQRGGAKGTAEVVAAAPGRDVTPGQRRDRGERGVVTGNGAAQHVGKHVGHRRVELEAAGAGVLLFVDVVFSGHLLDVRVIYRHDRDNSLSFAVSSP